MTINEAILITMALQLAKIRWLTLCGRRKLKSAAHHLRKRTSAWRRKLQPAASALAALPKSAWDRKRKLSVIIPVFSPMKAASGEIFSAAC